MLTREYSILLLYGDMDASKLLSLHINLLIEVAYSSCHTSRSDGYVCGLEVYTLYGLVMSVFESVFQSLGFLGQKLKNQVNVTVFCSLRVNEVLLKFAPCIGRSASTP